MSRNRKLLLAANKKAVNLSLSEEALVCIEQVARHLGMTSLSAAVESTMREKAAAIARAAAANAATIAAATAATAATNAANAATIAAATAATAAVAKTHAIDAASSIIDLI